MTPPRRTNQNNPDGVCAGHASFERMIENMMQGLSSQVTKLAEAVQAQSRENAEALAKVLANQSDRREMCGQQKARIASLESKVTAERAETLDARKEIWTAVNNLKFYVFIGIGLVLAMQTALMVWLKH